ncbi:DUF4142 domain-containing protein [Azospirillum sp. A39]|uniref:DUF4142 domain-containing protein n=1 Tax=Azospirillum sp. A39 TaxID=3462279 RepID=UPI00404665A6
MRNPLVLAPVLALLAATPAVARPSATEQATPPGDAAREFIMEAARGGMAEARLGKLAQAKAQSGDVKTFALRMVEEHGQANQRLLEIARRRDLTLPDSLDIEARHALDSLQDLSGSAFDRAYVEQQVVAHEKAIRNHEQSLTRIEAPEVTAFAHHMLPHLRLHRQLALQIAADFDSRQTAEEPTGTPGR